MAATFVTVADVLELAPELADVPIAQLTLLVETITPLMLRAAEWGERLDEGHRTLAAHVATLLLLPSSTAASGGAVTSRTIGQISESYAAAAVSDEQLERTTYGQMHKMLRSALRLFRATSVGVEPPDWKPDGAMLP